MRMAAWIIGRHRAVARVFVCTSAVALDSEVATRNWRDLLVFGGFLMQGFGVTAVVGLNKGCANQAQTGVIERKRFVSS